MLEVPLFDPGTSRLEPLIKSNKFINQYYVTMISTAIHTSRSDNLYFHNSMKQLAHAGYILVLAAFLTIRTLYQEPKSNNKWLAVLRSQTIKKEYPQTKVNYFSFVFPITWRWVKCVVGFRQLEPLPSPSIAEESWNAADFAGESNSLASRSQDQIFTRFQNGIVSTDAKIYKLAKTYRANKTVASIYRLYIRPPHRLTSWELSQQNYFSPFYCKEDNFNVLKIL
jgi:hypothetical protein